MFECWGCGLYTSAAYTRVFTVLNVVYYISDFWKFHVFSYIFLSILISCSWRHNYWFRSLQCSCNLSVHVYIFVLCHHLGLGKCGGLGWRKICQESMCEVEKVGKRGRGRKNSCNIPPTSSPSLQASNTIQDGNIAYQAFCSRLPLHCRLISTSIGINTLWWGGLLVPMTRRATLVGSKG